MLNLDPWIADSVERLEKDATASAYLRSRNILPNVVKDYNIGFVKKFHSISTESEEAGKWNQTFCSGKFSTTDRLVFPHHDDNRKVMSFSTRSLSSKYYSHFIPDYASFKGAFWGWTPAIEEMWQTKTVIITEGIFDLLSVAHFRRDVVCSLTRSLTESQFSRLLRYVDRVILAFDMDDPGRKGCLYWAERFEKAGKSARVLEYPHKDLNEWWLADPRNMLQALSL